MKIKNNIAETGIAETLAVLHRFAYSETIVQQAQLYIPFPFENPADRINAIAKSLAQLGKQKLLLLTPEIAVIEKLAQYNAAEEIIVCLPHHTYTDIHQSVAANMPAGIKVSFIHESELSFSNEKKLLSSMNRKFDYTNAAVVAFGFSQGSRSMILTSTYRMMKKYSAFYGCKAIAFCGEADSDIRPAGWVTVNTHDFFNTSI